MSRPSTKHAILLVDDNPEDYETMKRSFKEIGLSIPLLYCSDGDEALSLLREWDTVYHRPQALRPGLILLDLNLPGTDGREVLAQLKADPHLRCIPIVILTTSSHMADIELCYQSGANSYLVKPDDYKGNVMLIQMLSNYWFRMSRLPTTA